MTTSLFCALFMQVISTVLTTRWSRSFRSSFRFESNSKVSVATVQLRAGKLFSYSIPSDLFTSSFTVTYVSMRLGGSGYPLPNTLAFDAPRNFERFLQHTGVLVLELVAEDRFDTATRNITFNFTNIAPTSSRAAVIIMQIIIIIISRRLRQSHHDSPSNEKSS